MKYDANAYCRVASKNIQEARTLRAITDDETYCQLYDVMITTYVRGERWDDALLALPDDVAAELLAYVRDLPPRILNPRTLDPERRAAQDREAVIARATLIEHLDSRSR